MDSREVAEMVDKRHDNLVRDIDGYVDVLNQNSKLRTDDFFIESSYTAGTGKSYKCYLLTKKGCDMVANKMTIEKETTDNTPIEIALGIDEDGRTTAIKLYNFLGLDKSHYSRWAKNNIVENEFAESNVDYMVLATDGERNPNPTIDYKLSASFAKKLAMETHNKKGELAKD